MPQLVGTVSIRLYMCDKYGTNFWEKNNITLFTK